jgi:hypothetical protein
MYICRICSQTFKTIPKTAIELGHYRGSKSHLYRFASGEIHDLRHVKESAEDFEKQIREASKKQKASRAGGCPTPAPIEIVGDAGLRQGHEFETSDK